MPADLRAKMETARVSRAMEGERRTVTILFCDVRGSTALAEQFDPEEWAEIMNGAFERLIAPVYRYEGTVARLMGDAILAFFGAPIAHEDDPRRAVLAALDIVEGIRVYRRQLDPHVAEVFDVRVGINTGLVLVGEVGSDLAVEYTAMGDAVNLASRMEQTAAPGTIQISDNTLRLVTDLFHFEPLGAIEIKGKREPVETYRVLAVRQDALPRRGIEGLHSPLVGRDREVASLRASLTDLRAGQGRILAVTGEAGLGKSRLLTDVRAECERESAFRWLEGRSFSYERSIPFTPFISMLSRFFEIDRLHGDIARYGRVKERLAALMPGRESEVAPPLAAMLGIAVPGIDGEQVRHLEPPQLRGAIFMAVWALFSALAQEEPLVLLFEDLHWADDTSLELLHSLLPLTDDGPVAIIALFRPHRDEPSWAFHEAASRDFPHRYQQIALQPLDESDARALVGNLLWIEDLPEPVRELILQKAEGNPFFVEEVIRSLLDSGLVVREGEHWRATAEIGGVRVPDTLTGVITARLDRVPDSPRRVIQAASVIGRQFEHAVLADVHDEPVTLPPSLSDLQRRELILERQRMPDRLYTFKHGLTQETAYNSVLMSKRRELHLRVAECLERSAPERVSEIAQHFLDAKQDVRALPYIVEAGERARRTGALDTASRWFQEAIRIGPMVEDVDPVRRAYEGLGKSLELRMDVPAAMETYEKMYETADARGDIPMLISSLNKRAFLKAMMLGQVNEAVSDLEEAGRLGRQVRDARGLVEMAVLRCATCLPSANFDAAMDALGSSVDVAKDRNLKAELGLGLAHVANTLTYMARFDEAVQRVEEGMRVGRELGDLLIETEMVVIPVVFNQVRLGDLAGALDTARKASDLSRKVGSLIYEAISATEIGSLQLARGELEEAYRQAERSLQLWSMMGPYGTFFSPTSRACMVAAATAIGGEFGERVMAEQTGPLHEANETAGATAWTDLGFAALQRGDADTAADLFVRALTVPSTFWLLERPRALAGSALARLSRGDIDGAADGIQEARRFAEERGMRHFDPLLTFVEGQISLASGDYPGAGERFQRAEEGARGMGMRPLVEQALSAQAQVLSLLERSSEADDRTAKARAVREEMRGFIHNEEMLHSFDHARGVAVHG
jgi:class 3 adenylate cyclase/tetratricopeptide (TPR) repeat protein